MPERCQSGPSGEPAGGEPVRRRRTRRAGSRCPRPRLRAASEPRSAFGESLEPVVRYRLPRRRISDIGAPARAHPRIAVERPHAHAHLSGVVGVATEQMCSALAAEALLKATVRMPPGFDQLPALQQPEGAAVDPSLRRRPRAGATLAAGAMAVAGSPRRLGQLEANGAAQASARHTEIAHGNSVPHASSGWASARCGCPSSSTTRNGPSRPRGRQLGRPACECSARSCRQSARARTGSSSRCRSSKRTTGLEADDGSRSGRRVSNPRPRAWEARALPTELPATLLRNLPPGLCSAWEIGGHRL
jgi:hypothetical protein